MLEGRSTECFTRVVVVLGPLLVLVLVLGPLACAVPCRVVVVWAPALPASLPAKATKDSAAWMLRW